MSKNTNSTRREVEIETRRAFIVDTTRGLLATADIDATSMDEIAAAVQYTRRTLYTYFRSRDEILLMVFTEDLRRRWSMQQKAMQNANTGLDKLRVWAQSFFLYSQEHMNAVRLQSYWSYRGIDPAKISAHLFTEFEALNDELAEALREVFRQGMSDGTIRQDLDVDLGVSQFLYSLKAVVDRALSPSYSFAGFDPEDYVTHFLDLFTRAICTEKDMS